MKLVTPQPDAKSLHHAFVLYFGRPTNYTARANFIMIEQILARIFVNQWAVILLTSVVLLALAEFGYRFGAASRRKNPDNAQSHSGSVQGAVLGLLGLLLGFSFAMAVGRFDARRALVVQEANSISTTWLRTDFLPGPYKNQVRDLLIRYAHLKLDGFDAANDRDELARTANEIAEIHTQLWQNASDASVERNTPVLATFITSLNETIDLDSLRKSALRNHVPGAVWLLLFLVAGCGAWASGYGSGSGGVRSFFNQFLFPLLIAVVITLISDIDRAHKGLIGMNRAPLEELVESMKPVL